MTRSLPRALAPLLSLGLLLACGDSVAGRGGGSALEGVTKAAPAPKKGQAEAVFAGGCFWCMEGPFEKIPGVISVESGYTGGKVPGPAYEAVSAGVTGHTEAIRVVYDPTKVEYAALLEVFWHNIDPTQANGQFCDKGTQYRSGVFPGSPEERAAAEASKAKVATQLSAPIVTEITDKQTFWLAEDYHQDFYKKEPDHYTRYRTGCGRDRRLAELWGAAAAH
jgi:peptide-methionine (S)-S-oxide reductase